MYKLRLLFYDIIREELDKGVLFYDIRVELDKGVRSMISSEQN